MEESGQRSMQSATAPQDCSHFEKIGNSPPLRGVRGRPRRTDESRYNGHTKIIKREPIAKVTHFSFPDLIGESRFLYNQRILDCGFRRIFVADPNTS
jgi:hypothetical protein